MITYKSRSLHFLAVLCSVPICLLFLYGLFNILWYGFSLLFKNSNEITDIYDIYDSHNDITDMGDTGILRFPRYISDSVINEKWNKTEYNKNNKQYNTAKTLNEQVLPIPKKSIVNSAFLYSFTYSFRGHHMPPVYPTPKFPLPTDERNITSKVIWIYWDDADLSQAPFVVRKAIESWDYHNGLNWTIVRLTKYNLHYYMDTSLINSKKLMSIQARSDMIRLTLLAHHGGVWADATMLCMEPLDHWIWNYLRPNGFWMYSRRCSWFMAAARDSYLAHEWYEGAVQYWSTREEVSGNVGGNPNYHWMDGILIDLKNKNKKLLKDINKIPYLECNGVCSPHSFFFDGCVYEVNQRLHPSIRQCLENRSMIPHAMKMTYKRRCGRDGIKEGKNPNVTNGNYAIHIAFNGMNKKLMS